MIILKRMILVDGNSLMYRAFYATSVTGGLVQNSKGLYTNAVHGFARMMNTLVKGSYDNILVAFDAGKKTLRHADMPDYKAGRAPMPDEFRMQIAYIKQYLEVMRIKQYEQELYEADDIIGTMAKKAEDAGFHVDIYSSDKDLLQLVSDNTTVHLTKKGMTELESYTPESFLERYGIKHTQFIDLKGLMGDKSDNLPGIPGIGEKKAVKYLLTYESIDGLIAHKDEIKGADGEKIRANYESAILCKKMATILRDFDINLSLEDTERKEPNNEKLIELYTELEFKALLKEALMDAPKIEENTSEYEIVDNPVRFKEILIPNSALIFETYDYNYHQCPILAIGIKNKLGTFIVEGDKILTSLDLIMYLSEDNNKTIFNYKKAYVLCKRLGIELSGIDFDLLLATYVINPSIAKEEFKLISDFYEYSDVYYDEQIYGKGAKKIMPTKEALYTHVSKKANALFELKAQALEKINENEQLHLLKDIEIPLSRVLGKMEFEGMKIDLDELERQSSLLAIDIKNLEARIYNEAGREFNILSPKQLGTVLFEEMGIPYPKRKGNSSYSTDIEILQMIRENNPIVDLIIEYRGKTKLQSTYVEGLRNALYPDQKVHTIFQQTLTTTGRLSSIEPNLQNIPIRTPEGHLIRKMFIPSNPNNKIYSADYSQVELRVLAHMANVSKLIEAFNNNEDIHAKTAKEVFEKTEITAEDRRRAKAVNFGIVYGISAFGLAQDLGINNVSAANFIKKYYEVYPEIKTFMDNIIEDCKNTGYVKTLENRIRYIPDINSKIFMQREFAKRTAMNTPIQGTAADIIKIAMVRVDKALEEKKLNSKMLITVHDELVFEVAYGEEDALRALVKEAMEGAMKLAVKLEISDSFGNNWYEVK